MNSLGVATSSVVFYFEQNIFFFFETIVFTSQSMRTSFSPLFDHESSGPRCIAHDRFRKYRNETLNDQSFT